MPSNNRVVRCFAEKHQGVPCLASFASQLALSLSKGGDFPIAPAGPPNAVFVGWGFPSSPLIRSQAAASRSNTQTRDPSSRNRAAVAAPIPLAPPVIKTRLSFSPRIIPNYRRRSAFSHSAKIAQGVRHASSKKRLHSFETSFVKNLCKESACQSQT